MINNIEAREQGHLFEELFWFHGTDSKLVRGFLVADSLDEATVVVQGGSEILEGKLEYIKGQERGQATRILQFVPDSGTCPLIVGVDILSASGKSGV